jgi:hypothetical protein
MAMLVGSAFVTVIDRDQSEVLEKRPLDEIISD